MTHTTWFHFVKQPKYFAAVDEIRESVSEPWRSGKQEGDGVARPKKDDVIKGHATFSRGETRLREYNPLGKLPGSVWHLTEAECYGRIIKGWSPRGICSECGEGRKPVVDRTYTGLHKDGRPRGNWNTAANAEGRNTDNHWGNPKLTIGAETTILGYTCRCGDSTQSFTRGQHENTRTLPPTIDPVILSDADPLPVTP